MNKISLKSLRVLCCYLLSSFACVTTFAAEAPPSVAPVNDDFDASVTRGAFVFSLYCVKCHGVNADGNGRAAKKLSIKPANLRKSMAPDMYKKMIITRGGQAMARSESMPPFDGELTQEQLQDVVNYLRYIAPENAPR